MNDQTDFTINVNTIRVDMVAPEAPKGQTVGTPNYPVRVTHMPTGIQATACARSQHISRQIAMEMVEWGLTYARHLDTNPRMLPEAIEATPTTDTQTGE